MSSTSAVQEAGQAGEAPAVPFLQALQFWVKLGFISFGGAAGQIAIMHQELVERKQWISDRQFLRALNFCMLLPGPEAQQLATYMGWRLHGIPGGVAAGAFFVLPSVFVLLALSWLAVTYAEVPVVEGLFYGIQGVVLAIVIEAVLRIGRRALTHRVFILFAVGALVALQVLGWPFPLVIAGAALAGVLVYQWAPHVFTANESREESNRDSVPPVEREALPPLARNLRLIGIFLLLWLVPVGALWAWRGGDDVLMQLALFFTQAAFITFGGAYAVLTYVADVAVSQYQWLTAEQMVAGIGLAETTPGPTIMVTQYVGFIGAWNNPGSFTPGLYGTLGALVTTYVTFLPCFLFIFLGAPYIEFLAHQRRLQAALTGVTAAVVGVIANLAIFFGSNVLFPEKLSLAGLDWVMLLLAVGAFLLLRFFKMKMYWVILAGALIGMLWVLLGPG
jgi:chromate transporter